MEGLPITHPVRFVASYIAWIDGKPRTGFGLALSALLGTVPLSHVAAQQLDRKNWGKNSPGITLELREGPRLKTAERLVLLYNVVGRGFPPASL